MEYTPPVKKQRIDSGISQSPLVLALRYEDASQVLIPYVQWQYTFASPLMGYTKVRLLSLMGYNNYSSNRLSTLGLQIDEFAKQAKSGSTNSSIAPTFCVPNQTYTTTAFTSYSYVANNTAPELYLGAERGFNQITLSLHDGVGPLVTASGTPTGYFTDVLLCFYN